jgi:hypothetical protein
VACWLAAGMVAFIIAVATLSSLQLHRRSSNYIRNYYLDRTRLGSHRQEVIEEIRSRKLQFEEFQFEVEALLGEYYGFPFVTSVVVKWEFSDEGRLVNIEVQKTRNGL